MKCLYCEHHEETVDYTETEPMIHCLKTNEYLYYDEANKKECEYYVDERESVDYFFSNRR